MTLFATLFLEQRPNKSQLQILSGPCHYGPDCVGHRPLSDKHSFDFEHAVQTPACSNATQVKESRVMRAHPEKEGVKKGLRRSLDGLTPWMACRDS